MVIQAGLENFVPMVSQWQLQSEKDIYDSFDDWDYHRFICIMKDNKEVFASGITDEGYEGNVSKSIWFNDESYSCDDILFWMEIPDSPNVEKYEVYGKEKIKNFIEYSHNEFIKELTSKK